MGDLLFEEGPADPHLVFGTTGTPPDIRRLGSALILSGAILAAPLVAGAVPMGLSAVAGSPLALALARVPALSSAATLSAPSPALSLSYDNAVNRAPFRWANTRWQQASDRAHHGRMGHHA